MQPSSSPTDGGGRAAPSSSQLAVPGAAAEDDASTSLLDVLALVLQHSDLLDGTARDFCSLLQTSKGAAATAVQQCHGRLRSVFRPHEPAQAQRLVPWLARHGQAIGSLQLTHARLYDDPSSAADAAAAAAAAATAVVAGALRQSAVSQTAALAAAAGGATAGLQLCSLSLSVRPATAANLLEVGGSRLTSLTLLPGLADDRDKAGIARAAAALSGLQALQQLELRERAKHILPALSGITTLTRLTVEGRLGVSVLRHIPSQLQELVLSGRALCTRGNLLRSLQHCTALRQLELNRAPNSSSLIEAGLPVTLEVLRIPSCRTAAPLLPLNRLTQLEIWQQQPPAAELLQLAQLTSLSSIKLRYDEREASVPASAEAWGKLPGLQELKFCVHPLRPTSAATMQHLAMATSLTWLELSFNFERQEDAGSMAQALAAALPSLSRLEVLALVFPGTWLHLFATPLGPEPAMAALAASIASLPCLHTLQSGYVRWGDAGAQLATASQLTRLTIDGSSVQLIIPHASLTAIVCGLTQLRSLQLGNGVCVTDECLASVARHLQHLTHLRLGGCSDVSLQGISQLAQLPRLWKLQIVSRRFSTAILRAVLVAAGGGGPWLQLSVG